MCVWIMSKFLSLDTTRIISGTQQIQRPSIKYVMLFWTNFDPPFPKVGL